MSFTRKATRRTSLQRPRKSGRTTQRDVKAYHCFCRIQRSDRPAQIGKYGGWTTPYSYNTVRELQLKIGLLVNNTCLRSHQLEDLIICRPGQIKLPLNRLRAQCVNLGLECPPVGQLSISTHQTSSLNIAACDLVQSCICMSVTVYCNIK